MHVCIHTCTLCVRHLYICIYIYNHHNYHHHLKNKFSTLRTFYFLELYTESSNIRLPLNISMSCMLTNKIHNQINSIWRKCAIKYSRQNISSHRGRKWTNFNKKMKQKGIFKGKSVARKDSFHYLKNGVYFSAL